MIKKWINHFLNEAYKIPQKALGIYRICFAGFFLIFGIPTFSWINKNPDIFFSPPYYSFAAYFSGFPPYLFLLSLDLLLAFLFVALLFGYRTKVTSILITIVWLIGNSFKYSFGKINHDIIPVLVPFIMAFTGWGKVLSLDSTKKPSHFSKKINESGIPIAVIAVLLSFAFFTAGFPKLLHWIDFDLSTQGVRNWVVRGHYQVGRDAFLLPYVANIDNRLFWEVLDILAVVFELGFFISVFKPSVFKIFVGLAVLFHFNNLLILNISFSTYLIVYLLFTDWSKMESYFNTNYLKKALTPTFLMVFSALYLGGMLIFEYFNQKNLVTKFSPFNILLSLFTENVSLISGFILLFLAVSFVFVRTYKSFIASN